MPADYYLGIDPGVGGGMAVIGPKGMTCTKMPDTERDVWEWLSLAILPTATSTIAVIEKVGGFMGNEAGEKGGNKNRASAHVMFTFGKSYGSLRMALIASYIPFDEVVPRNWQKVVGIAPRASKESKTQWKNRIKAKAQQLYPQAKVTLNVADAIMLAHYAMLTYRKEK